MTTIDLETTKNQARKLLDSRIESVTDLTLARKRVEELREELAEAEREDKKAYVRATKDGWSEDELKKLGLESGGVAKRRARRTSTDSSVAEVSAGTGTE
ncbi:hypothetical protein IWX65_003280 [Arthrobacter sp. CAN_A214]|uniref:hypothetical protein n=1 Tax=Arthrobacter sp. CAN_A214 TaxID=2787720 RepID=UPI0018CAC630